jgi:hypothetical protein
VLEIRIVQSQQEQRDAMLERLTILRGQMLPPRPAPGKRN